MPLIVTIDRDSELFKGVGKKKIETRCASKYQPDFFNWAGERNIDQGFISVNQTTYTGGSPTPIRKVFMPETAKDVSKVNSTYRLSYGSNPVNSRFHFTPAATSVVTQPKPIDLPPMTARHVNPNKQNETAKLARMRTRSAPPKSTSVQDCLIWFDMVKTPNRIVENSETTSTTTIAPLELGSQADS